jgi:hypothetical protein
MVFLLHRWLFAGPWPGRVATAKTSGGRRAVTVRGPIRRQVPATTSVDYRRWLLPCGPHSQGSARSHRHQRRAPPGRAEQARSLLRAFRTASAQRSGPLRLPATAGSDPRHSRGGRSLDDSRVCGRGPDGLVTAAHRGTLVSDEVGNMPPSIQPASEGASSRRGPTGWWNGNAAGELPPSNSDK